MKIFLFLCLAVFPIFSYAGITRVLMEGVAASGNTVYVDTANVRVGIGNAAPTVALDVTGTAKATAFSGPLTGTVTGTATEATHAALATKVSAGGVDFSTITTHILTMVPSTATGTYPLWASTATRVVDGGVNFSTITTALAGKLTSPATFYIVKTSDYLVAPATFTIFTNADVIRSSATGTYPLSITGNASSATYSVSTSSDTYWNNKLTSPATFYIVKNTDYLQAPATFYIVKNTDYLTAPATFYIVKNTDYLQAPATFYIVKTSDYLVAPATFTIFTNADVIRSSATGTYPLSISGSAASVPQSGVNLSTVTSNHVLKAGDTMAGILNMGGQGINNVSTVYSNAYSSYGGGSLRLFIGGDEQIGATTSGGINLFRPVTSISSMTVIGANGLGVTYGVTAGSFTASNFYGNATTATSVPQSGVNLSTVTASHVLKAGDTMTGPLTLSGSTLTVTGADGVRVSAGDITFGTGLKGIKWADGSTSTTATSGGGGTGITTYTDYSAGVPTSTPTAAFQFSLSTRTGSMYVSVGTNLWNWGFIGQGNLTAWTASYPAGLTSWYDASNGVTPTTAGSTLTGWNDWSATANHLTIVSGTPQVSTITQNGLPMVYFDGTDYIYGTNKADDAQPYTIFVAFKPTAWGTGTYQSIFNLGSTAEQGIFKYTGNTVIAAAFPTSLQGDSLSNLTPYIVQAIANGANSSIQANAATAVTGNAGTSLNESRPLMGSNFTGALGYTGYIMEVLVYNSALSAGDQAIVRNYLNAKWAIY